jgi:predicted  nucleic acid-binding Zn-ribbon protein
MRIAGERSIAGQVPRRSETERPAERSIAQETESLVIEILKKIQADISGLKFDMVDLKHWVSTIERNTADIASSYAGQSARIDRLEERLDRIERQLELSFH